MTKRKVKKIEQILWVYLMDCLAIHHNSFTKKFKTIPEAQRYYTEKILMELPKPKGK